MSQELPVLCNKRPLQVLLMVYEHPGINPQVIATELEVWPSQVGQILKRLKNEGIVVSKQRRKDLHVPGYVRKYACSQKGEEVARHIRPLLTLLYPEDLLPPGPEPTNKGTLEPKHQEPEKEPSRGSPEWEEARAAGFTPSVKACSSRKCPHLVWTVQSGVRRRVCDINDRIPGNLTECPREVEA